MIKRLAIAGLLVSGLAFGSADGDKRNGSGPNCKPVNSWEFVTTEYVQLMNEYKEVKEDTTLTHSEKVDRLMEISEEMRQVDPDGCYLNQDYNDCMRESNAQHDKDYNRCDRNGGSDKCYDRADKNFDKRSDGCERVSHADKVGETISNWNNDKGSSSSGSGSRGGKKSGGMIGAGDRRR